MPKIYHAWTIIAIAAIVVGTIIATAIVLRRRRRRANLIPTRNLSKVELEKEKLRTEIRGLNKSQFNQPSFWMSFFTFLIAVITYLWLLGSGVFDAKQAHLTYVTDTLEVYKQRLDTNIFKLHDSASKLNDSIHNLISRITAITAEEAARISLITAEEASVKKKYQFHQKENLTKKELVEKTEALVKNLKALTANYRRESDSNSSADFEHMKTMPNQTEQKMDSARNAYMAESSRIFNSEMNDFDVHYKMDALYLRNEMEKYIPKNLQGKMNKNTYLFPTNSFGIEEITGDLDLTLRSVKATVQ